MPIRNLLVFAIVMSFLAGCQSWRPDEMPPSASLPQISEEGVVEVRYWEDLNARSVSDLISLPAYPDNPDTVIRLNELRSPANRGNNFGSLAQGFIIPPEDGEYQFFVSGDDETQFWLSNDQNPENAEMIAVVPGYSSATDFNKYSSQASPSRKLTAGTRYYFEIRHVEISSADHFSVAWEGPGFARKIISGSSLASLGQSPYKQSGEVTQEDIEVAYRLGYRIGFFDGTQNLTFRSQYPPLDMDQDGLYDNWEIHHGLDPNNPADTTTDQDDDLLTTLDEFWLGTSPTASDSDGDGILDGVEFAQGLNPMNPADAHEDLDGDGYTNLEEYQAGTAMDDASDIPAPLEPETTYVDGFVGQYFRGTEFNEFVMTRTDGDIDFRWGRDRPAESISSDKYSVRWVGEFKAPHTSGTRQYQFTTTTDDGVRLFLNGELVVDKWQPQGPTPYAATVSLGAGETISVVMEYFEAFSAATAMLDITDLEASQELSLVNTISTPTPGADAGGRDSDNDGIPDSWELAHGLNPWKADADESVNDSGVTNMEAYQSGVHPWTLAPSYGEQTSPSSPDGEEPVPTGTNQVTLSWTAPLTRTDGSSISLSEIQSYEIVYGQALDQMDQTVTVDGYESAATIDGLEPGTWYFSIRTIDSNNTESRLSEPVAYEVN